MVRELNRILIVARQRHQPPLPVRVPLEVDETVEIFIKQGETEFIFDLCFSILINVNNGSEFLEGDVQVSVLVCQLENSIT